jgi:Predicted permease
LTTKRKTELGTLDKSSKIKRLGIIFTSSLENMGSLRSKTLVPAQASAYCTGGSTNMALAFFLEALIILYIPEEWRIIIMGKENSWAIFTAGFLRIPVYISNLSALPMGNGLLAQGMSPAAALAFLIVGPTTTLPAMAAVGTLVEHRIFFLCVLCIGRFDSFRIFKTHTGVR